MRPMRMVILFLGMLVSQPVVAETTRCDEPMNRALALDKAGQKSDAAPLFRKAIQLCTPAKSTAEKQALAKAHIRLGIYDYGSDPAQALLHFRKAVELDPDNLAGSLDLAAALIALNAYGDAVAAAE